MKTCHICSATLEKADSYTIKEQYFGTREAFQYLQCPSCECLQIADFPEDLSKYYPDDYYSKQVKKRYSNNGLVSALRSWRLDVHLTGSLLRRWISKPNLNEWFDYLNVSSESRILDVGCGKGQRLLNLRKKGFRHLEGVEPYIEADCRYDNGVVVHQTELVDFAARDGNHGRYDIIMMHHSLEHMEHQHEVVAAAHQLLAPGGQLLIRIPVCTSYAWEHYRENWVQLDAPRHLFLHSLKSIRLLGEQQGFAYAHHHYDSSTFQFAGSERYLKGMSLVEAKDEEIFSQDELNEFKARAEQLNAESRGDQIVCIFRKKK